MSAEEEMKSPSTAVLASRPAASTRSGPNERMTSRAVEAGITLTAATNRTSGATQGGSAACSRHDCGPSRTTLRWPQLTFYDERLQLVALASVMVTVP